MQALWSDFGDIEVPKAGGGYDLVEALHDDTPGAYLERWINVPGASDTPGVVDESHIVRLAREVFPSNKVEWVGTRRNSPYSTWGIQLSDLPATWPFYKISRGCHAYTTVQSNPAFSELYKSASVLRVDMPMFAETYQLSKTAGTWKRYPANSVVIMLDIAWAHYSKDAEGVPTDLIDWKYQQLHLLNPPKDVMLPGYSDVRDKYALLSYGQLLGILCPLEPPSYEHEIQWIKIHVYNTGDLVLYCPGISVFIGS